MTMTFHLPSRSRREWMRDLGLVMLGNFSLALSTVYFTLPFQLLTGGVAGLAVIFQKFWGWDESTVIYCLNIGLFLAGTIFLGTEFSIKTVLSTILYPVMVTILQFFSYRLQISPVLAAAYAGILLGVGTGLVFRTGGSTGGMDIPALLINKYLHIELGKSALIVDSATVVLGWLAYGIEAVLVGLLAVYLSSRMIDKVLVFNGEETRSVFIISSKWQQVSADIQNTLQRGTTIVEAKGGYKGESHPMIFCVIRQRQYADLVRIINHADPLAFFVTNEATEAMGQGFSFEKEDRESRI